MKFEKTEVWGFDHAIRGMRNPMESWVKSDSIKSSCLANGNCGKYFEIGQNDLHLMQKLIKAGSEHRKFLRQIFVSVDITAPQYFMAELDTYKVGVTRNSTSIQHKGTSHRYTIDDFDVHEKIKEVLRVKTKDIRNIVYPYETNEYKVYVCDNGRKYKVYRNGRIFSCAFDYTDNYGTGRTRHFEEREVVPSVTNSGYYEVNIGGRNGEKWLVHRLVATAWLQNEANCETVDHLNCDKCDNSVENLQWVTREENIKRQWENFDKFDLQKCYKNWKQSSKVNPFKRRKVRELYEQGKTQRQLADMFELSQSQISVICRGDNSTSENRELFENCWYWEKLIDNLNILRDKYLETNDYDYFRLIRQLMPMSYLYTSTVTMNYENILNMARQRQSHKLTEWSEDFMVWVKTLPYANELLL